MSNTLDMTPGEDLYWKLHSLSKILEGSGLIDQSQHPDAYATILDAMAFVRGTPQPVVREPLSDAEIEAVFIEHGWSWGGKGDMYIPAARDIERAHGITQRGGSNGL